MRIAHLAFDQKFIPFAQNVFEEAFPGDNSWFLLHDRRAPLQFVSDLRNVSLVTRRGLQSRGRVAALNGHPLLVVHAMIPEFADVVKRLSPQPTVLWIGWGYEYYAYLENALGGIILRDTASAWERALADERSEHLTPARRLKSLLRPAYRMLTGAAWRTSHETIKTVAARIDLCCVSPSEMPLLRAAFPGFRAKHYQLHYFSKEDTLDKGTPHMAGRDILLGNSATPENNHVEAIDLLRRMPLAGRKIIAPLNYGHSHYAEEICRLGAGAFGSSFVPLRRYLPIDEYHDLLATCGTVIMNHRRQAAMGSISAALYKGARVVLREENPIYQTYSTLGAVLDSLYSIEQRPQSALVPLSSDEQSRNRKIVGEYMDRSNLVQTIRNLEAYCRPHTRAENTAILRTAARG